MRSDSNKNREVRKKNNINKKMLMIESYYSIFLVYYSQCFMYILSYYSNYIYIKDQINFEREFLEIFLSSRWINFVH